MRHSSSDASSIGGGASAGFPRGAPASTQRPMAAILVVGQRRVLLEPPDADVALDEPRRHLALRGLVADGPRPRPHLLVGQQRHRRHRARPVALLARALQYRQHVPGERHLTVRDLAGRRARGRQKRAGDREHAGRPSPNRRPPVSAWRSSLLSHSSRRFCGTRLAAPARGRNLGAFSVRAGVRSTRVSPGARQREGRGPQAMTLEAKKARSGEARSPEQRRGRSVPGCTSDSGARPAGHDTRGQGAPSGKARGPEQRPGVCAMERCRLPAGLVGRGAEPQAALRAGSSLTAPGADVSRVRYAPVPGCGDRGVPGIDATASNRTAW